MKNLVSKEYEEYGYWCQRHCLMPCAQTCTAVTIDDLKATAVTCAVKWANSVYTILITAAFVWSTFIYIWKKYSIKSEWRDISQQEHSGKKNRTLFTSTQKRTKPLFFTSGEGLGDFKGLHDFRGTHGWGIDCRRQCIKMDYRKYSSGLPSQRFS